MLVKPGVFKGPAACHRPAPGLQIAERAGTKDPAMLMTAEAARAAAQPATRQNVTPPMLTMSCSVSMARETRWPLT